MVTGELIDLRAIDRDDVSLLQGWLDDPELMRWWGYGAPAISRSAVLHRIEGWLEDERVFGHPVAFVIATLEGEAAGFLVLSDVQPVDRSAELGLFLEKRFRGMSLGRDALATACDAAFEQWNLHRLSARSEAGNTSAHRFFQRNGFALEGRMREARYIDGGWSDILIFGRLRNEDVGE